jgi:hypothetical protein
MKISDEFCSNCGEVNRNKVNTSANSTTDKQLDSNLSESPKVLNEGNTSQMEAVSINEEKKNAANNPIVKKAPKKNNSFLTLILVIIGFLFFSTVISGILAEDTPETNSNVQTITSTTSFPTSTSPTNNVVNSNDVADSTITEEAKKVQICEQVASDYYKTHTYTGDGVFDCDNMAQDVWNILETKGINSEIWIGNVDRIGPVTLKDCNHAWVMAEVSPNTWLAVECTGGYVVYLADNEQYYQGFSFENPKNYQRFLDVYTDWEYQYQDYENYRIYYNNLVDEYNDADYYEQLNLQSGLTVARNTLDEKEKTFLRTDAELSTLLEYG